MQNNVSEYMGIIKFIQELERLKNMTRYAWTSSGRRESIAEHSWRLSVLALLMEGRLENVDFGRAIRMCLIHDMGEAYEGDVSAKFETSSPQEKLDREKRAMDMLVEPLPDEDKQRIMELWQEYNEGRTEEAKLAKALDKIETIIQHNQGNSPVDFDYAFNLDYGKSYALYHPVIQAIREIVDEDTRKMAEGQR